ncbi:Mitochondrial presequence protease, partial [Coniosporium uncinatum]
MNAFTSADHTSYPFATTNAQDFKNLMSVYLDATLHPNLDPNDFTQEGWRIGPENPKASGESASEQDNRLVFKGVVYNEMKGQMSDASYLYYIRFHDHLFPSLHNSGGDPQKMTDLTYEQLKGFHHEHYHPSNAKVFTYGDMPLVEHLKEIGERLDSFEQIKADREIKTPISLSDGPKNITVQGPTDPLVPQDAQYKTSTTWLVGEMTDTKERFSLSVLSSLLLDGYGSPLYRGLIDAGLGSDFSPNTGFDPSGKVPIFSVGLTGVKSEDVPKVKEAIVKTLSDVKANGFDKIKVDGILHQLELSLKHKTANFGMGIMQRLKPGWFNGIDPFDALAWQETVDSFKQAYASPGYLEGLLEKYLLNDNTLTFTMEPSQSYGQQLAEEETSRLASKILETTKQFPSEEEAHKFLAERELELLKVQEQGSEQDLSCLPSVHVTDIPRQKEKKEVRDAILDGVQVQWREAPTNGLTYFRAVNTFKDLPDELRQLIPLFSEAIMRLGTKNKTMEQLEELIKLKTGGINVGYHASASPHDIMGYEE